MKKIIFIILFIPLNLLGQQEAKVDSLLKILEDTEPENISSIEDSVIGMLYNSELNEGEKISEYLQQILPNSKFQDLYVLTLIHSWRFYSFDKKIDLLNKASQAAHKLKDFKLIGTVDAYKSIAFRDNYMTDSAMTYALKANDNLAKSGKPEDLDEITNLIADLYYWAGQYEKAESLYKQLLNEPSVQNTWRFNTIRDDLGQIRIKQKKYSEAEKYFKATIDNITSKKMLYADSAALPYIFRMLLEINVKRKHFPEAEKYYLLSLKTAQRFGQNNYLPSIFAYKADLFFEFGKYDSAITLYNKALELNKITPNIDDQVHIYEGLSKTYDALNDIRNVNKYLVLLKNAQDSADSIFYRSRYMTTLAEYNYNNYKREISGFKQRQTFLFIIISIITVSLFTIGYFFIRLGKANRMLVAKSIEAALTVKQVNAGNENRIVDSEHLDADSEIKIKSVNFKENKRLDENLENEIILRLGKLMHIEKLYLQTELTMDQLAGLLSTNRAYLSKAINNHFNMNFSNYINDLRIKEAIRIITSGEYLNLNVEGIAQKAGFNNRVSFNKAFFKTTGVSPSFFIKHAKKSENENPDTIES